MRAIARTLLLASLLAPSVPAHASDTDSDRDHVSISIDAIDPISIPDFDPVSISSLDTDPISISDIHSVSIADVDRVSIDVDPVSISDFDLDPDSTRLRTPCGARGGVSDAPRAWTAPLDRRLRFHARDVSLRDALDRLAAAAKVRLTYSADLLPLDRRVCLSADAVAVGDALAELLAGTAVEPVVAGADHVVLAPRRTPRPAAEPAWPEGEVVALERIVVTGSAGGAPQRTLPVALDVIGRRELDRGGTRPLNQVMSASLAGPWAWEQAPNSLTARYGSIRGAASFGVTHPKVFIDGIEVANPLLVTQLAPESVERIEVIRGPQGAALYGTDAISGVVNIVTRHEGTNDGRSRVRLRTGLGRAGSEFAPDGALSQEHAVSVRTGSGARTAGLTVAVGGTGEYVPEGASRYVLAGGGARRVGARSIATATARFYAARAGASTSPLLAAVLAQDTTSRPRPPLPDLQSVTQYTLGASLRLMPGERWTHTLVAGIDGDRLSGVLDERAPLPSAAEAALRTSRGGADRATLRAGSVARLGALGPAEMAVTLSAEHSVLREESAGDDQRRPRRPGAPPPPALVSWTHNTGVVAQTTASFDDRLHLTGGLRVERHGGLAGSGRFAVLPVAGAAWITGIGPAQVKVRGAYGKGIRPARTPGRDLASPGSRLQLRDGGLDPEEQSGLEGGIDVAFGRALSLQITRFDQIASGLIQRVALPLDTAGGMPLRTPFNLQNVGRISNHGWEMQAAAQAGPLSLSGALSRVDSRVRRVAEGYAGDLRPGDRMLEVPARTLSLTAAWTTDRASASLSAYRASDWINYDRLALARDFVTSVRPRGEFAGAQLRRYWRRYDGVTRLGATAQMQARGGLTLVLTGDNLLDEQRGEPDNLTIVPGRTLTLGLRAEF